METGHQEQMESLKEAIQAANEQSMQTAEASMQQIHEAMMAITQREGAPIIDQPVLPPARQRIALTVKPTSTQQMIVDWLTWYVYSNCKRMCTHEDD